MAYLEITILNGCSLHSRDYPQNSRAGTAVSWEGILQCYQPVNKNTMTADKASLY